MDNLNSKGSICQQFKPLNVISKIIETSWQKLLAKKARATFFVTPCIFNSVSISEYNPLSLPHPFNHIFPLPLKPPYQRSCEPSLSHFTITLNCLDLSLKVMSGVYLK